ncbi:hypothetical protein [Nocardioides jensenii]|uniref:hypothetical protein n=1 Tax=Nocardioides jensenii TaxID=1843 RepID=UPI0012F82A69|nr:hypothetical protein [Nocardioides jensenii]
MRRRSLLCAGILVVAGATGACSGDDSAADLGAAAGDPATRGSLSESIPDDASTEDFCAAYADFVAASEIGAIRASTRRLGEVGTPPGFDPQARAGLVLAIDLAEGASSLDELSSTVSELDAASTDDLEALASTGRKTCPEVE